MPEGVRHACPSWASHAAPRIALECTAKHIYHFAGIAHGDSEVFDQAVVQAVNPAVHGDFLATAPGVLHDVGQGDVADLLDHVHLAHDRFKLFLGQMVQALAVEWPPTN